jgi:hypothetical protein
MNIAHENLILAKHTTQIGMILFMRLDHLSYAAEPDGLTKTAERLAKILGIPPKNNGISPKFGVRSTVLPLKNNQYIEILEAIEHPAMQNIPFKQTVKERSQNGGGWTCWVVAVENIKKCEQRLQQEATSNRRHTTEGTQISWLQIGAKDEHIDPQLPFIFQWLSEPTLHPSTGWNSNVCINKLNMSGSSERMQNWLNPSQKNDLQEIPIEWTAPKGNPGILSVTFETEKGVINI